jgi:CRISPR-associated protein Cas2
MAADLLHIVASYDIGDPRRLLKVAKTMKNYGERVLKSVFECNLAREKFEELKGRIDEIIEPVEDTVRYYVLCEKCLREVEHSGKGEDFQEDEDYWVV